MRIIGYALVIVVSAGLLIGLGIHGARHQQSMLSSYRPTPANIEKIEVRSSKMGGFEPSVSFSYRVGAMRYSSQRFAPLLVNGSRHWADSVVEKVRYTSATAYVNPSDPSEAYLMPIGRFRPFGLILAGLVILNLGLLPLSKAGVFSRTPGSTSRGPYDWFELKPSVTITGCAFGWSAFTLWWYTSAGVTVGYYYHAVPPTYEAKALVAAVLYAVAGLWPAYRALRATALALKLRPPGVRMIKHTVELDEPIIIRIDQKFSGHATVREVRVALSCIIHNGIGLDRYFKTSHIVLKDRSTQSGDRVQGEYAFEVPEKKRRPSTPGSRFAFPRIDWVIEVTTQTSAGSHTASYPIKAVRSRAKAKAA